MTKPLDKLHFYFVIVESFLFILLIYIHLYLNDQKVHLVLSIKKIQKKKFIWFFFFFLINHLVLFQFSSGTHFYLRVLLIPYRCQKQPAFEQSDKVVLIYSPIDTESPRVQNKLIYNIFSAAHFYNVILC